jgi:hypothetical protein
MLQRLKIGLVYFALVFGTGFVLGPIRILWLAPKVGVRTAELIESPIMILVTWLAARWMIRRFAVPSWLSVRLEIGGFALLLLISAEVGVGIGLRGMPASELITTRDPISGTVYFLSLALFALMPALVLRPPSAPVRGPEELR